MTNLLGSQEAAVLTDLVKLGTLFGLGTLVPVGKKLYDLVKARIPAQYQTFINAEAHNAVQYIEKEGATLTGSQKFQNAVDHLIGILNDHKVPVSAGQVKAAIQSAYNSEKHYGILAPQLTAQPITPADPTPAASVAPSSTPPATPATDAPTTTDTATSSTPAAPTN